MTIRAVATGLFGERQGMLQPRSADRPKSRHTCHSRQFAIDPILTDKLAPVVR
jgi:hypothetical protein